jgi:hypothetical protein
MIVLGHMMNIISLQLIACVLQNVNFQKGDVCLHLQGQVSFETG